MGLVSTCMWLMLSQLPEAEQLAADPDAPFAEVGWRSSVRAKIGLSPNLLDVGSRPRFRLRLPSFVELSNSPNNGSVVPWIFWRARIQLEGLFMFRLSERAVAGAALRLEHESDHATQGSGATGWINLNSIALLGSVRFQWDELVIDAVGVARLHVLTCTIDPDYCIRGGGAWGDRSYEGALGADVLKVLVRNDTLVFDAFGAAWASYTAPTNLVVFERRLTLRAGVGLAHARSRWGRVYVYLSALFGSPAGFQRGSGDVAQLGFGFGWGSSPPAETPP